MLKIYTKTGDKGKTSLYGGKRVSKASLRVETYGTVDELNAAIGVAIAAVLRSKYEVLRIKTALSLIQNDLLDIGSALASPNSKNYELRIQNLDKRTKEMEELIDELTAKLPELRNFILPGGCKAGSFLHLARTICRRAERRLVELGQKENVDELVLKYVNRLSDLLFTMARFVNHKEEKKETLWKK